ncbi:conserved hypothetical protein [Candidatus Desulfarcum epimagneticum]|uniref:Uncharacterized protein n=1 Tax=uncultured Desulfobacteraceae bacterium TaxID=218296 RepID=A0A484HNZ0_9BACT|nr:conserved hypothetical protein [uncultured Desulfobacteraceae bacterium]
MKKNKKGREHVNKQFNRVAMTPEGNVSIMGLYALVDYVHFKGDGTHPIEDYDGQKWGLMQVLLEMPDDDRKDPRESFAEAAKSILRKRVEKAPVDKKEREKRWFRVLWEPRINTYNY